jgi:hypothetical protein
MWVREKYRKFYRQQSGNALLTRDGGETPTRATGAVVTLNDIQKSFDVIFGIEVKH